jgi:hypothetical protein
LVCRLKAGAMSSVVQTPRIVWQVLTVKVGLAHTLWVYIDVKRNTPVVEQHERRIGVSFFFSAVSERQLLV